MLMIAGVDGCKGGWICITKDLVRGDISSGFFPSLGSLLEWIPAPVVLAVDMPIGLTEAGSRQCDKLARKMLGRPRASSVFPAPIRPALQASSREQADEISRSIDGRGVGAQAWGLYPKIRQVDEILQGSPLARRYTFEVHPEVCFMEWNGGAAIAEPKGSAAGMAIRTGLVDTHFGKEARGAVRERHRYGRVADDDIHDAFAALWTAERIRLGQANLIPDPPDIDSTGIEMGIWF